MGVALALFAVPSAAAYPPLIGRANLDGSDPDYSFITADARWLAADDNHLYWSNGDPASHSTSGSSIGRANLNGTGVDPTFIDTPGSSIDGVAVDSTHIYWADSPGGVESIGRAKLDGTRVRPRFITETTGLVAGGVAVDAAHVYWANFNYIGRANLDGTGVDPTFIDEYNRGFFDLDGGVAVQGRHVYWSHIASNDEKTWIARANRNGTGIDPTFIDPQFGSGESNMLTADSSHLYWDGFRGITRANPDGTGARTLVPGATDAMAVNSSHIYWSRPALPAFILHKPIRHKYRGTATLPLDVFGPGDLVLSGTGLQTVTRAIESGSALEKLPVKPRGRTKRRLERRGHVRVTAEVTFTLTGANPTTRSRTFRLVQR